MIVAVVDVYLANIADARVDEVHEELDRPYFSTIPDRTTHIGVNVRLEHNVVFVSPGLIEEIDDATG